MSGYKTPAHGFSLLSKNNLYGLASELDMSDRTRCLQTFTFPEFALQLLEITCENSAAREFVPVILPDQVDLSYELDFTPVVKAGGTDDFLLFLPPAYKADQTGVTDVSEALNVNTYVYEYTAVTSSIGGGALESGSTELMNTAVNSTLSGESFIRQTFDADAGVSTLGFVLADGTDPASETGGSIEDRTMFVINAGSFDFGAGAVALTAGQKLVYDFGGTDTWTASATWA